MSCLNSSSFLQDARDLRLSSLISRFPLIHSLIYPSKALADDPGSVVLELFSELSIFVPMMFLPRMRVYLNKDKARYIPKVSA